MVGIKSGRSPGGDVKDVPSTLVSIQTEMYNAMSADKVLLYFVGHGTSANDGSIQLGDGATLTYNELDSYLDFMQNSMASSAKITTIIDTCMAGSAIDDLTYVSGKSKRLHITSCRSN